MGSGTPTQSADDRPASPPLGTHTEYELRGRIQMRAAHTARDNSMDYARPGLSVATASLRSWECNLPCEINDSEARAANRKSKIWIGLEF